MGEEWEKIRRRVKERVGDRGSKKMGLEETSKDMLIQCNSV